MSLHWTFDTFIDRATRPSLPWLLLVAGIVAKAIVLALFHITEHWRFAWVALDWDPIGTLLSEKTVGWFFDQRRLVPGVLESATFEICLVILFGMQCFVVAWIVKRLSTPTVRRIVLPRK